MGEVTLTEVNDGGLGILPSLNYPFKNIDGTVLSYPSKSLYYLNLEGYICLQRLLVE